MLPGAFSHLLAMYFGTLTNQTPLPALLKSNSFSVCEVFADIVLFSIEQLSNKLAKYSIRKTNQIVICKFVTLDAFACHLFLSVYIRTMINNCQD